MFKYGSKLILVFLFGFLSIESKGTTHVFISDGHGVFIGSDGYGYSEQNDRFVSCKISIAAPVVFLDWGDSLKVYWVPKVGKPTVAWDFKARAAEIISAPATVETKYQKLMEAAETALYKRATLGQHTEAEINKFHIGGLLVWIENDSPRMREFEVRAIDPVKGKYERRTWPAQEVSARVVYQFPESFVQDFKDNPTVHMTPDAVQNRPGQLIKEVLDATSSTHPHVGKPYTLVV